MGLSVRTNTSSLNSCRNLKKNTKSNTSSLEKLASGYAINRAGDDASGLAISEKMKAQIRALDTASANCENGINLVNTIDGYINEVQDMVVRMVELTMKSANGILEDIDREALQEEMDHLGAEVDRIADTANFNGNMVMNGTPSKTTTLVDEEPSRYNLTLYPDRDILLKTEANGGKDTAVALNTFIENYHNGDLTSLKGKSIYYNEDGNMHIGDRDLTAAEIRQNLNNSTKPYEKLTIFLDYDSETVTESFPIVLQVGETSQKSDKLVVTTYDFHTDKIFKPTTVPGTPIPIQNETPKSISLYGTSNTSGNTQNNGGSGIRYVYNDTLAGNFKTNEEKSSYENAVIFNISDQDSARENIDVIKNASEEISMIRGYYGALQNRLEYTVNNLDTTEENISAANSRIRDTDMAKEMMAYTQTNVLTQAAQAMLAQANTQPQNVLSLLQ